ncbi:DUF4326 domain-containing protein [Streptomyces jumonjinensis]|uniref:DUF4326 domain-containing protein n=1 Tax=Streptomyces jumonjinensis TaxID=1945 RepID=A0A646KRV4_STRJU|nr:DUF4326 domain-containing protein [Streptomyces jumonjinensis]MQT05064.1 DUF4326 domain-containing protein [Streptomyces jumonjinensis]
MPKRLCGASGLAGRSVFVGHGTRYDNPFRPGFPSPSTQRFLTARDAVDLFAATLRGPIGQRYAADFAATLRGLDLVCTCPPGTACHADVLLRLANDPDHDSPLLKGTTR